MSENEKAKPAADGQENDEIVLDLNFAPNWARTSPEDQIQRYRNDRYDDDGEGHDRFGGRDRRPARFDGGDRDRRRPDRRPPPRRDRDERRGDFRGGGGMPRPASRGAVADLRGATSAAAPFEPRGPRPERRGPRTFRPVQPALPVDIRVLPEQKALGAVIRRIQTSRRAFPLRDIAWLFLNNPNSCLVRIEPLKDQPVPLFQCKVCGMPALAEEDIRTHLLNRHMEDFFDVEEVPCEPPTGVFVCVARCGMSGVLLGPPNHHSFNAKVQEMLRTRYANLSEEAYRARIEMVRDTEVVETWRQQCTRKKIYRRKGATPTVVEPVESATEDGDTETPPEPEPKAPAMERETAELVFLREILPAQIASVRHLLCTASVAMQTSSRPLYYALKDILTRERRFPASLFFALRGAFRHRNLHLFRVNDAKGQDFVMFKPAVSLDPTHAVQALRDVLTFVNEHPACTKAELATALAADDEAKLKETLVQLAWLVEKGHVIQFYNDVLSGPLEYPAFRFLPGEKTAGGRQDGPRRPPSGTPASGDSAKDAPADAAAAVSDSTEETVSAPAVEKTPASGDSAKDAPADAAAAVPDSTEETASAPAVEKTPASGDSAKDAPADAAAAVSDSTEETVSAPAVEKTPASGDSAKDAPADAAAAVSDSTEETVSAPAVEKTPASAEESVVPIAEASTAADEPRTAPEA
ncbi:MAG TPA: hypothetical protein PLZ74_07355 [Kiritimatiellia bacterium]|nr:hypothetical protein [Kiritimatiellia bacterium]